MNNWFKIHRDLLTSELWVSDTFSRGQAWLDLIGLANFKDGYIRVRGNRLEVKRGQVGWSISRLAERWMWSRAKVSRFFSELESEQQIEQQKSRLTTLITIVNYEKYQSIHTTDKATDEQQTEQQTNNRQSNRRCTNKESKERNNKVISDIKKKNTKKSLAFQKPSVEEIQNYCTERSNTIDAERFYDFYESKNWHVGKTKMKDWKASVRNWERNQFATSKKPVQQSQTATQENEIDYTQQPNHL